MADNFNFTQQRIEKLPIPEKDRKDYYDTEVSKWIAALVLAVINHSAY